MSNIYINTGIDFKEIRPVKAEFELQGKLKIIKYYPELAGRFTIEFLQSKNQFVVSGLDIWESGKAYLALQSN